MFLIASPCLTYFWFIALLGRLVTLSATIKTVGLRRVDRTLTSLTYLSSITIEAIVTISVATTTLV
jgi:hypothetical protein